MAKKRNRSKDALRLNPVMEKKMADAAKKASTPKAAPKPAAKKANVDRSVDASELNEVGTASSLRRADAPVAISVPEGQAFTAKDRERLKNTPFGTPGGERKPNSKTTVYNTSPGGNLLVQPPKFTSTTDRPNAQKFMRAEDIANYGAAAVAKDDARVAAGEKPLITNTSVQNATFGGVAIMDDPETAAMLQRGATVGDVKADMASGVETPISGDDIARVRNYRPGSVVSDRSSSSNRQVDPREF